MKSKRKTVRKRKARRSAQPDVSQIARSLIERVIQQTELPQTGPNGRRQSTPK